MGRVSSRRLLSLLALAGLAAAAVLVLLPYQNEATQTSVTSCDPGVLHEQCQDLIGADEYIVRSDRIAVVCPPAVFFFAEPIRDVGIELVPGRSTETVVKNSCMPESLLRLAGAVGLGGIAWVLARDQRLGMPTQPVLALVLGGAVVLAVMGSVPFQRDGRIAPGGAVSADDAPAIADYEDFTASCTGILGSRYTTSIYLDAEDELCGDAQGSTRTILLSAIAVLSLSALALSRKPEERERLLLEIANREAGASS